MTPRDVYSLLDEVRAIAQTGLHYASDPFDRERYARLLELSVQEYAERGSIGNDEVRARFEREIGYSTARVGADAAVFDDADRLLLVRRADDGKWGLVSGWVDPNESPEHTVVRELAEETGSRARVDALVGVFFRPARVDEHPHGTVSVLYLCTIEAGPLRVQEHEVAELAWRDIDAIAADEWHHHHASLAHAARAAFWRRRAGI